MVYRPRRVVLNTWKPALSWSSHNYKNPGLAPSCICPIQNLLFESLRCWLVHWVVATFQEKRKCFKTPLQEGVGRCWPFAGCFCRCPQLYGHPHLWCGFLFTATGRTTAPLSRLVFLFSSTPAKNLFCTYDLAFHHDLHLADGGPEVKNGRLRAPRGPGLGVNVKEELLGVPVFSC